MAQAKHSEAHRDKMAAKKARNLLAPGNYASATSTRRRANYVVSRSAYKACTGTPASINRHTGKPHEHRREIARRARQSA